jgi:hypothetical protein
MYFLILVGRLLTQPGTNFWGVVEAVLDCAFNLVANTTKSKEWITILKINFII